ncbi:hypothetical protein KFE25_007468 [Diacronema lutheri]|uniref:Uncharacterized protein n=1 Tax=Diacronema lutheri TaxID=2081491 RepID=A0A8J6CGC5_DIALT|nr:hypothetical protein KFE25_007468 [Diacronema lutheri]
MHLYARRGDPELTERNALAAYNEHKHRFGVPREARSVHYQLPSTRADDASKRLGARQLLPGKAAHAHVPASLDASAEYSRPAPALRAWRAPHADGRHARWTSEQPPQRVAFGSAAPRGSETSKARDLARWRERVALEARAREQYAGADAQIGALWDDRASAVGGPPARVATVTAFDMANGRAEGATPHCAKCGQDRFFCPHRARAPPAESRARAFSAGAPHP